MDATARREKMIFDRLDVLACVTWPLLLRAHAVALCWMAATGCAPEASPIADGPFESEDGAEIVSELPEPRRNDICSDGWRWLLDLHGGGYSRARCIESLFADGPPASLLDCEAELTRCEAGFSGELAVADLCSMGTRMTECDDDLGTINTCFTSLESEMSTLAERATCQTAFREPVAVAFPHECLILREDCATALGLRP